MLSKSLAAISAVALIAGSSAAAAQTAQPLSLAGAPAAASVAGDSELTGRGAGIYLIGAIVIGLLIWGGIELLGDDDEDPSSP